MDVWVKITVPQYAQLPEQAIQEALDRYFQGIEIRVQEIDDPSEILRKYRNRHIVQKVSTMDDFNNRGLQYELIHKHGSGNDNDALLCQSPDLGAIMTQIKLSAECGFNNQLYEFNTKR
jgi:hypothetical protein